MAVIDFLIKVGGTYLKKKYIRIVFLLVFCFIYTTQLYASRAYEPAKIASIMYKDIKIVAENSTPDNMGVVQAFNVNTNKLVWSKKVYKVTIKPGVEDDTQWIFIKEIKIDNDKLLVINESNKIYEIDPNTGEIVNHNNSIVIIRVSLVSATLFIVLFYMHKRRRKIN